MRAESSEPTAPRLVQAALAGDKGAFADLVAPHQRTLRVLCEHSLGRTGLAQ